MKNKFVQISIIHNGVTYKNDMRKASEEEIESFKKLINGIMEGQIQDFTINNKNDIYYFNKTVLSQSIVKLTILEE